MMKWTAWLLLIVLCVSTALADEFEDFDTVDIIVDEESFETDELEREDPESKGEDESLLEQMFQPARFTLRHEVSYKTEPELELINNRSSFRLEYSKFFLGHYFLQFDTKLNVFWGDDHRAVAEDTSQLLEMHTKEVFLQASFGKTSIKIGKQIIIWGESDGGAITDVVSPRDLSELFFISLEESRIGQNMLVVDQYAGIGTFTLFYIPEPDFVETPEEGTAYYYNPYGGNAVMRDETSDDLEHEYGMRWKKTFGKSDISLMAASLIDNEYACRVDGYTSTFQPVITRTKQRYTLLGTAFNYAWENFLFKGEIASKSPKAYTDSSGQIVEKNARDIALGLEYSPGGAYTIGLEAVNHHIENWEESLRQVPEDSNSLVFVWSDSYMNEDLSINWMTSYSSTNEAYLHSLRTSYQWDDNLKFELNAFCPDVKDKESPLWIFRDQKQVALVAQYQF